MGGPLPSDLPPFSLQPLLLLRFKPLTPSVKGHFQSGVHRHTTLTASKSGPNISRLSPGCCSCSLRPGWVAIINWSCHQCGHASLTAGQGCPERQAPFLPECTQQAGHPHSVGMVARYRAPSTGQPCAGPNPGHPSCLRGHMGRENGGRPTVVALGVREGCGRGS